MRLPAPLLLPAACLLALTACTGAPAPQPTQPAGAGGTSAAAAPISGAPGASPQTPVAGNASPAPSTRPPAGAVTAAALPTGSDLGGWSEGATGTGGGTEQLSVCQQNRWESTGATGIVHRSYTRAADSASAVALSFDSAELATQAYQTTQRWFADCSATLQGRGGQAKQVTPARQVPLLGDAKGELTEWSWAQNGHEAQALVLHGNRLAVVAVRAPQPAGKLERTLPATARRLSS